MSCIRACVYAVSLTFSLTLWPGGQAGPVRGVKFNKVLNCLAKKDFASVEKCKKVLFSTRLKIGSSNPSAPLSSLSIRFALPIPSRGGTTLVSRLSRRSPPQNPKLPLSFVLPASLPLEIFPSQWYKVSPPLPPSFHPTYAATRAYTTIQKGSSKQMREGKERCVCVLYHPRLLHVCRVSCFRSVFFSVLDLPH